MQITIELDTSPTNASRWERAADDHSVAHAVAVLLESLVAIDMAWLRRHGMIPLYASGVEYCCVRGPERFADIGRVLDRGGGDCAELSAWRIAELRMFGDAAVPIIELNKDGNETLYHVLVMRSDGSTEDPSIALGMEG